jgi:SNF2 family DNA or RNA helicase
MNARLVFMNYDILAGWKNFGNRRVGTLVFDEIHLLSNKSSRRSKAAMFLSAQAERVIGATGTPLWNRPAGLYTTLTCISPGAWGKYFDYASRYAGGRMGAHGFVADGASHEEEFRVRMQEIMLRRTWHDVIGQVPPITRNVEVVEITERQAFQIEKEAERARDHGRRATAIGAMARFRRLLANLKIDGAIDVAKRVLDSGERVIIWTWHRDVAIKIEEALAKMDFPGFVVTGSTNPDIREEIFNRWRAHPCSPLCITLSVGQVGIDLSSARQEVFAELDYTPSIVAQAEMRPFNGQQPIAATYVIIDHDIERQILEALQTKCDLAFRLGVPAAESAIEVIASGFTGVGTGVVTADDFAALADAVLADHPEDEGEHDYHGTLWTYDWEAVQ